MWNEDGKFLKMKINNSKRKPHTKKFQPLSHFLNYFNSIINTLKILKTCKIIFSLLNSFIQINMFVCC